MDPVLLFTEDCMHIQTVTQLSSLNVPSEGSAIGQPGLRTKRVIQCMLLKSVQLQLIYVTLGYITLVYQCNSSRTI